MEASEKPQLPLDSDSQDHGDPRDPGDRDSHGIVRALEDRLVIEALTITDARAAQVVRDRREHGQEPPRTVTDMIEIGARVLDREEAAVEVDFVRREYERAVAEHRRESERHQREAVERVEREIRRAFGDGNAGGALAEALEEQHREMATLVEETFGEGSDEAVPRRIQALIEQRNREFLERLSANDELNPLRPLLSQLATWARDRREAQDERDDKLEEKLDEFLNRASELVGLDRARDAIEEAEEAGTRKGRTVEERVCAALERIAHSRGDAAYGVGDERGAGGSKKGDVVVEIEAENGPCSGRMVFEVKDSQLSRPKAWEELKGALGARSADFAVLVVAGEESVPPGTEQLHEYEGNKLIIAVDPDEPDRLGLELAYRFARCRILLAREEDLTLDAAGVRTATDEARAALGEARTVKSALTTAKNSVEKARTGVETIEGAVLDRLARIESLIAAAEPDSE
jgi:hypothetical protein